MATKTFTAKTKGQWVQLSTLSNFDFVDGKDYTLQVLGTAKFGDDGKTGILIDSTTPYTYTHKSGVDLYVMTENEDGAVITVSDSASLALATRGGGSGGGSGDAVWGSITGTLSDQTDLQTALDAKIENLGTGIAAYAIGRLATATGISAYTFGQQAQASGKQALALGYNSKAYADASIAIGNYAEANAKNAIQIVGGTNSTADTLQVKTYQLLDLTTGKIPNERLSTFKGADGSVAGSAGFVPAPTATDNDKYLKGDGTWATVSGGSGIQNTATGTDSLTIMGTPNTTGYSVNIGIDSEITAGSEDEGSTAIGCDARVTGDYGTAIGSCCHGTGRGASSAGEGVAIGSGALSGVQSVAIGNEARDEYGNCIVLGHLAYSSASFQFVVSGNNTIYQLMDLTTGKIPNDRINGATGSFTSQDGKTVTVTNGVITSIA